METNSLMPIVIVDVLLVTKELGQRWPGCKLWAFKKHLALTLMRLQVILSLNGAVSI